jgi:RNA polymerase sigma-70 factor (ECF subfamily)
MTTLGTSHTDWIDQVVTDQSKEQYERFSRQKEARDALEWALSHLSTRERMVLELVSLKEYSVKEAARLLGWSSANVKVRAFRARGKLKKLFEDSGKDI